MATGKKFVDEATLSAASVKKHMPDVPITMFTDIPEYLSSVSGVIDTVFPLSEVTNSCRDKIKPLIESPYEKTLFLDTDTFVCESVYDVFDMLDRFDIALCQAPDRYQYDLPEIPACFTELNSGVIAYRANERVKSLLKSWEITFLEMLNKDVNSTRDQHSLRHVLYRSEVSFFVLPPEYNFRTICPNFAGKRCRVKIIHGRHANVEEVSQRLNKKMINRVFLQHPFKIFTSEFSTYIGPFEAMSNFIFERLPSPIQRVLSTFRNRFIS